MQEIQFRKDDLSTSRQIEADLLPCAEGEIIAKIDHYSLTANNVTYGVVGERIGYWHFFHPTEKTVMAGASFPFGVSLK